MGLIRSCIDWMFVIYMTNCKDKTEQMGCAIQPILCHFQTILRFRQMRHLLRHCPTAI